jgi:hypothetical protein
MFKQPWIQYMFFYLPKVIVRNQSKFKLSVLFVPISGDGYPSLIVQPDSSRAMTVFAGKFNVDLDSDAGILKREYDFKAGEQYELTYRAEEIPLTRIVGTNNGNSPAYVTFDGPKKREFVINPGGQEVKVSLRKDSPAAISTSQVSQKRTLLRSMLVREKLTSSETDCGFYLYCHNKWTFLFSGRFRAILSSRLTLARADL